MLNENSGAWPLWQVAVTIAFAVVLYLASGFDDIEQGAQDAVNGKEYSYESCCCK